MSVLYTVYIEAEYDATGEGDYRKRAYSVDCRMEDLAFISQLPNATRLGNSDSIIQVAIHHASSIAVTPPEEHFESLESLLVHFGTIHFRNKNASRDK